MAIVLLQALLASCLSGGLETPAPRRALAKLALASGTVDARAEADADYKALATGSEIAARTWVRTGAKSKAAFDFGDGTELRVNENSEIFVEDARRLELKVGQIYLVAVKTAPSPFKIKTQFSPIEFAGGSLDASFIHRDPNDPAAKTVSKTVTTVVVLDGTVEVGSRRYNQKLTPGYWCTLVDATLNTPDPIGDPTVPTRWVHDLLLQRGKMTLEIESRLQNMLQMLGRYPKTEEDLSEKGYRSLGELSAPFLAKYLKIPPSPTETTRRRAATRVLADLAGRAQAPDLALTLRDADAETRVAAARGLERLAGTNQRFDEAFWRGEKREAGEKAWDEWVKKNPPPKR